MGIMEDSTRSISDGALCRLSSSRTAPARKIEPATQIVPARLESLFDRDDRSGSNGTSCAPAPRNMASQGQAAGIAEGSAQRGQSPTRPPAAACAISATFSALHHTNDERRALGCHRGSHPAGRCAPSGYVRRIEKHARRHTAIGSSIRVEQAIRQLPSPGSIAPASKSRKCRGPPRLLSRRMAQSRCQPGVRRESPESQALVEPDGVQREPGTAVHDVRTRARVAVRGLNECTRHARPRTAE